MPKPILLLLADWFAPGYRAGGPIRSCVNLALLLREDFDVRVLTSDRDHGATAPYEGIESDTWLEYQPGIKVYYLSAARATYWQIAQIIREVDPDCIYLNSMFSRYFTIYPLLMKRRERLRARMVLAPRGMLRNSALRLKHWKKKIYLLLFRGIGIQHNIFFHATNEEERDDIYRQIGRKSEVFVAPNVPAPPLPEALEKKADKSGDVTRLIFVGRVHPIKNLLWVLQALQQIRTSRPVRLSIVGPVEDPAYWAQCQAAIAQLPAHVEVENLGQLPPNRIAELLPQHHFLVLPTQGENFGHAIFEAFAAALPVIISDQTPWRNLTAHQAGWDVPLDKPATFARALQAAVEMDEKTYREWSAGTLAFARQFLEKAHLLEIYREMFTGRGEQREKNIDPI